ncbi:MAG TPA: amino acid permease [Steroidobacteraceae bacterium]|jgi:APA family basic amino acid/polyamine antiporter|nr:amino acid permease [Steroidobacteraceae bacterium]
MSTAGAPARALGLLMCVALVVGNTIGVGIFMLPASLAPYGMNALPAWLITTVGCTFIAWVFAGLARQFADDDGPYAYAARAFGGFVAFILMWCYWISTWVTNAVLATGVTGYLSFFFPELNVNHSLAAATAVSFIWLFVLINILGARTAGWVQVLTTLLKLVPQLGVIALGLWAFLAPHAQALIHVPPTPVSLSGVIAASTLALYAMLGVESAAMPAGRVKDPGRTIPRATFIGTLLVAVVYICVSLVPMLLIPQAELAASSAPFADLFARHLGAGSGKLLAAFVIVGGLGCLNGWTLILGELTVSFARHGGFPRVLARVNAHGAPTWGFVITAVFASVITVMNYNDSMAGAFTLMSVVVTAANLPIYIGCALAVLVLWRRGQIPKPGPREARWIGAALLAAIYCAFVSIGIGGKALWQALTLCAVGVPVYGVYWWHKSRSERREALAARA